MISYNFNCTKNNTHVILKKIISFWTVKSVNLLTFAVTKPHELRENENKKYLLTTYTISRTFTHPITLGLTVTYL